MKNRFKILAVLVLLMLFGVIYRAFLKNPEVPKLTTPTKSQHNTSITSKAPDKKITQPDSPSEVEKRRDEVRSYLEKMNVLIEFWGKVIDQDGNSLEGVRIKVRVAQEKMPSIPRGSLIVPRFGATDYEHLERETDSLGNFHVSGVKGSLLGIDSLVKEGYELSKKFTTGFHYYDSIPENRFIPDPQNPIVYRMWKKVGAEPLLQGDKFYKIVPDGKNYTIDLVKGKKIEGDGEGDLLVDITRPPGLAWNTTEHYNWSFAIEGIGGGVIETEDEFMNLAPESGYQARYVVEMKANDPHWTPIVKKKFFIRSRNGKIHAKMEAEIVANYQQNAIFSCKYYVNPTGSRNLEFDPQKYISQRFIEEMGLEKAIEEAKEKNR